MPNRPLRHHLPEVVPTNNGKGDRVGFFLGCVMNLFFAQVSQATVRVLAENGCEIVTPRDQKCCGAPHQDQGDEGGLKELARHNIEVFDETGVDVVVTDCAACGAMLKEYQKLLADDTAWAHRAKTFSNKVKDISEFLAEVPLKAPLGGLGLRVTYHEPCHLVHAQQVSQQPRQLLQAIPGLELVEMEEANWCCGGAGIYSLTHYERSMRILERKMENIAATKAEVVVTGNPGCLLQLRLGVEQRGLKLRVAHTLELLDDAYRVRAG